MKAEEFADNLEAVAKWLKEKRDGSDATFPSCPDSAEVHELCSTLNRTRHERVETRKRLLMMGVDLVTLPRTD